MLVGDGSLFNNEVTNHLILGLGNLNFFLNGIKDQICVFFGNKLGNVTVTGKIKNYKNTVEFDSGCTLDAASTPAELVDAAYALADGSAMDAKCTLTGVITTIDTAYNEQYGNITVTIQVGDMAEKTIMCYRLKGEGAADLAVGQTITVYGKIKNYKGTIEFDSGCVLVPTAE